MLPKRQWAPAALSPVATLARLTMVDTAAGENPWDRRMLDDVGPNPMPRAPSTIDARNPANPTMNRSPIPTDLIGIVDYGVKGADPGERRPSRPRGSRKGP